MTAWLAERAVVRCATHGAVSPHGPVSASLAEKLSRVADAFEADADDLASRQATAVEERFPSYARGAVPHHSLIASGRRNVGHVVSALRSGESPKHRDLDEIARATERTVQGVPAGELHAAYRACLLLLADHFTHVGKTLGLDGEEILFGTRLLWETADVLASVVVTARQSAELDIAREDESQRGGFLRALILDSPHHPELVRRAPAFGLPQERLYWVVRAKADQGSMGDEIRARMESETRTLGCAPLFGVIDGDLVGIVPNRPKPTDETTCAGVDGPVSLERVPHAFANASRMLDVAAGFGMHGVFDLADLALRVPVASEPELGKMLAERYLGPLRGEGEFGELLEETLAAHVMSGGRIKATASTLGVHPNTIRHRLGRIEELVGIYFSDLDSLIELWWAITWRTHERGGSR